ncbi:MAG TPA: polysaccharide deacetylase family protein [Spirochaetia bacterium]|nr:polysaccharide deacetylase family protein [Spirochaetia bacterium]
MRNCLLLLFFSAASACFGQVTFSGLDLSPKDSLLFMASATYPDYGAFNTLFLADARTKRLQQLTWFPEHVLLLQDNDVLQIHNRYGVFRSGPGLTNITPLTMFPSFVGGNQIQTGRIAPIETSPDGRYLLYTRATSAAYGELTLIDAETGAANVVSSHVELSLEALPATWSPDSRFVVYSKAASLYYFSLAQMRDGRILTESLRRIGDGTIANVAWSKDRSLIYISGLIVYAINPSELFTRALYAGFLSIGKIEGKIPFNFDSNFDSFWVSPDGRNLLLDKGGRNLFLYYLAADDFHPNGSPLNIPYLYLPRDTVVRKVIWSTGNIVTMLCETRSDGIRGTTVFRLTTDAQGHYGTFVQTADTGVLDINLSPDESVAAIMEADAVSWRDYATWKEKGRAAQLSPVHVLWLSQDELLVAGAYFIDRLSVVTGETTLVALSQPGAYGFAGDSDSVETTVKGTSLAFDEPSGAWRSVGSYQTRPPSAASADVRVYLQDSTRGSYSTMVMVRDAKGYGTTPLFPPETAVYEPYPLKDEPVSFTNFTHGSRIRRREVSLVFNCVDSAEGLTGILNTLSVYRIRATFFVNGEFIRRYPDAVREIALSGHEVGSLFSTYFTMTDSRFGADASFVKAGLARNEDDYFAATGRELSLEWHAPFYIVSSAIIAAGAQMNYAYVGRDLDTYDWVAATDFNKARGIYFTAAQLVERVIAQKKPGSIVPVQVGMVGGPRDDYLFQKLDLLINELSLLGYQIVPVSTLMEHAR